MVVRYSTCHYAEVMKVYELNTLVGERCSFCGEPCHILPAPRTLGHDIELTLRRWKDGDCTLDEMFDRLNTEYRRAWNDLFEIGKARLQKGKPKYEWRIDQMDWSKVKGSDLQPLDSDTKSRKAKAQ